MAFQYFLYLPTLPDHAGKQTTSKIAYDSVDVVLPFWQIGRTKTVSRFNVVQKFMKLHYHHQEAKEGVQ